MGMRILLGSSPSRGNRQPVEPPYLVVTQRRRIRKEGLQELDRVRAPEQLAVHFEGRHAEDAAFSGVLGVFSQRVLYFRAAEHPGLHIQLPAEQAEPRLIRGILAA